MLRFDHLYKELKFGTWRFYFWYSEWWWICIHTTPSQSRIHTNSLTSIYQSSIGNDAKLLDFGGQKNRSRSQQQRINALDAVTSVEPLEVNRGSCDDLLPQLQLLTQHLDHWNKLWHENHLATVNYLEIAHMMQSHSQLAKNINNFWYSSSERTDRSCCRSLTRSCLSSSHCSLKRKIQTKTLRTTV